MEAVDAARIPNAMANRGLILGWARLSINIKPDGLELKQSNGLKPSYFHWISMHFLCRRHNLPVQQAH
jgi:hypothetical protein